jgi:ABC-type transport system involved in multi-copper enzyme maturation permease subunit
MSPAFRSLLIKEWSERRRFFWCALGLLFLNLGYCIAYEVEYRTRAFVASYFGACLGFLWLGAILLAMSTANGEYSQRTLRFSAALPVSLRQIAWARLLGAWGCLIIPILCGALLVTTLLASGLIEQAELRPADYGLGATTIRLPDRPSISRIEAICFLWTTVAIAIVLAVHTVTLLSLVGSWCRSEETVGLLGALVALISLSLSSFRSSLEQAGSYFAADWISAILPENFAINWGYGELDGSNYTDLELAPLILGPLIVNSLITLGLGTLFARRYGCRLVLSRPVATGRIAGWMRRLGGLLPQLGFRWPGQVGALVWLNTRQSVSLCLVGLMMAGLVQRYAGDEARGQASLAAQFAGMLPSSTWFVGILWGAIVAVAIFSSELKTGLEQFWRSRPISPARWFWTKFIVGLAALLITIDFIPALLARSSSFQPDMGRVGIAFVACMPLLHTMIYALTVAVICRWRRPIPAAVAALMLYFLLDSILESIPVDPRLSTMNVYNQLNRMERDTGTADLTSEGYPIVYGVVAALIVGATLFARRMIVPPVVLQSARTVLLLTLILWNSNASCAEPPNLTDIETRIHHRDESLKRLHLRATVKEKHFPAPRYSNQTPVSRRRPTSKVHIEQTTYDFYTDGSRRAWTQFDTDGQVIGRTTYDGSILRIFTTTPSSSRGNSQVATSPSPPSDPFLTLDILIRTLSVWLSHLSNPIPPRTMILREVDGEQLLDIQVEQKPSPSPGGTPTVFDYRFQITLNRTRNDWPVRLQLERFRTQDHRLTFRQIITCNNWLDIGPIAYPKQIIQQSYIRSTTSPVGSDELELMETQEINFELVEINPQIPESIFTEPFPVGTWYYDQQDRKHYEVDSTGTPQIAIFKPKGLQGAVLAYHLLWITAALIYFVFDSRRARISFWH